VPDPITTFAFILATLFGAVFHLIVGGDARKLALYLLAGWIGFGAGHATGILMNINILNIGTLHIFSAAIGALFTLGVARFLTSERRGYPRTRA